MGELDFIESFLLSVGFMCRRIRDKILLWGINDFFRRVHDELSCDLFLKYGKIGHEASFISL
jgi:hypothetical protein